MFVKNYNSEASFYPSHNTYSAHTNEQWDAEKEIAMFKCDVCNKKCNNIFLSVDYNGYNVYNYCSKKCWGNVSVIN